MAWNLSAWLALGRTAQLLGSLVSVASHGYLTVRLKDSKHGLSKKTTTLELLACLFLGYSILALVIQQTSRRSNKTRWLKAFVVCDVLLVALLLGIINVLARGGLPKHCAGLTKEDLDLDEDDLPPGFTTVGFSDESPGARGELDGLCEFAQPYYVVANALVFTYIFTITATLLRILESRYTRNTKVDELLDSLERADDIRLKRVDSPSLPEDSRRLGVPPPPSEGILTRNTSLRSNFTATTTTASHTGASGVPPVPRRPVGQPPALPRRPVPSTSVISSQRVASPATRLPLDPVYDDEEDENAESALVADGMRHQRSLTRGHSSHHHLPAFPRMPMLSEENQSADAALVSDGGMRPADQALPPYEPGNRRMSGHGGDNELRLSGYVKGQTRAQNMKDSGGY